MFRIRRGAVPASIVLLLPVLIACSDDSSVVAPAADPLLDGLRAYYRFAGNTLDETANGHDGTLLGGATVTGGALVIGSNDTDVLSLPFAVVDGLQDFSFAGWVKMTTFHVFASQWISCAVAAEANNLGLYYDPTPDAWGIDILGDRLSFAANAAMEDGDWHHIVVVRDGSTVSLYVDAALVGSLTVSAAPIGVDAGGFMVGQDQDSLGGGFSTENSLAGETDELRIYGRALGAGDVTALHQLGR